MHSITSVYSEINMNMLERTVRDSVDDWTVQGPVCEWTVKGPVYDLTVIGKV